MSRESVDSLSLHAIEEKAVPNASGPVLSPKLIFGPKPTELLTAEEIADRLKLPVSWVRSRTRSRSLDRLPSIALGRYRRYEWAAVERWLGEHRECE